MDFVKYLLIRCFTCIIIFAVANELYYISFWKDDISKHGDILENLWVVDSSANAIYFGESSNFHKLATDTVKHRISHLLDDLLPEMNIGTVDNSGLHAGTYLSVINNISASDSIKVLIITMNLRSFGAGWRYSVGENYLAKTELMLSSYPSLLKKFLVSLKAYDYKTNEARSLEKMNAWSHEKFSIPAFKYDNVKDWDFAMASHEWLATNPELTPDNIGLACHYIKSFAFQIDTLNNERIQDFDEIMKVAKDNNYKVVFNLLGENMVEAKKLVGKELIYLMDYNSQLLTNRYQKQGAVIVNNLYSIPDSCFVDRNWPTEHYSIHGKMIIAKNLNQAIRHHILTTSNH